MSPHVNGRLIATSIDHFASTEPSKLIAAYPVSNNLRAGFRDVTVKDFANAINSLTTFIEPRLGYSGNFDVAAYFGPMDMRYHFVVIALVKLGWVGLMSAPRNSALIHGHFFESTACRPVLHIREVDLTTMMKQKDLEGLSLFEIPTLDELLWSQDASGPQQYLLREYLEEARHDPFLILHSSGSTGLPKPIWTRNSYLMALERHLQYGPQYGKMEKTLIAITATPGRMFAPLPLWHASGQSSTFWVQSVLGNEHVYV